MCKVINLAAYRHRTRKVFLGKHGARLDRFIARFIESHVDIDFQEIARGYQDDMARSEVAWDYVHFREVLADAFDQAFGKTVYELLAREFWFDATLVSQSEIVERCLSAYIMGHCAEAVSSEK